MNIKNYIRIKILSAIFCFFCSVCFGQSLSTITYDAGTTIEVGTGADVYANDIIINGVYSGGGTICSGALPVTMLLFSAAVESKNNVILNWTTGTEINNSGFDIERKPEKEGGAWQKIAFVPGGGNTNEPVSYSYEDKKLQTGKYQFRLKQIDYNGAYEYFNLTNDIVISAPKNFSISQNYPNPSNPKSKIDYELPDNMIITIKVYDIIGREVMTLIDKEQEAGYYVIEFDGSNMASGVYIYRVQAGKFLIIKKMVLIK